MKRHLIEFLVSALVLTVVAAGVLLDARRSLLMPLDIPTGTRIDLPPGSRLRDATAQMREQGLFTRSRQSLYLEIWGRLSGRAAQIKAGEYSLDPGLSSFDVMTVLISGKTVLHELRVVEGLRFDQALGLIAAEPALEHRLPPGTTAADAMARIGMPGRHPEGRFFPDTYRFPKGTSDIDLLRQGVNRMDSVLNEVWQQRAAELPYRDPEDALVMASIVEKETGLAAERARIAGVFVRRLNQGMRLQTDPTVIYGLGSAFDGNLRKADLLADGPYNTYMRSGLPPSPICLPGRAALEAAVNPAAGEALFFVARGDGSHEFSATLAEHEAAVQRYQLKRGGG